MELPSIVDQDGRAIEYDPDNHRVCVNTLALVVPRTPRRPKPKRAKRHKPTRRKR